MPPWPGRVGFVRAAVTLALLAGLRGEGPPAARAPAPDRSCPLAADLLFPVELTVRALDDPVPGGLVRARVEVQARRALGTARVLVSPPSGVRLLTPALQALSPLSEGDSATRELLLQLPPGRERLTVEVAVEVDLDQGTLRRSTILNLVFDPEPSRLVVGRDGRAVREVPALRIGS